MVMKFSPSQFVYTIMHYVYKECRYVAGSERQLTNPPPTGDSLVHFMANHGQKVIAFAPASPIAMPVAEQAGRAFAELTIDDFKRVLTRPGVMLTGFAGCYGFMPLLALGLSKAFGLTPALTAGMVLVGSINGGQASNLCTYIAKGDVALSASD